MDISIFVDNLSYKIKRKKEIRNWIRNACKNEGYKINAVNVIITTDENIIKINREFLGKNYSTDIISFNYSIARILRGEIYISYDMVLLNYKEFSSNFEEELHRVIIHGFLHLMGYNDNCEEETIIMRKKEDEYLKLLKRMEE